MEHPLVTIDPNATLDDLQSHINSLTKKLAWAHRNNNHLAHQIRMVLESYQTRYKELEQQTATKNNTGDRDFSEKIDIS